MIKLQNSPLEPIKLALFDTHQLHVDMKRDDLLHPIISGNKWRKLKYLFHDAEQKRCKTVVSMGGNWSNHLHALAFTAKELGFKSTGYIRAHPKQELTPALKDCQDWGMQLLFTSRGDYAQLRENTNWNRFHDQCKESYWISEGGFSELAVQGVMEIAQEVDKRYDYVFCGVGSGATLAGLTKVFPDSQVIGVAAFKGAEYLKKILNQYLKSHTNWHLETGYHCGGFAKVNSQLLVLAQEFETYHGFAIDKQYNAKVLMALQDYVSKGLIEKGSSVLWLNTGGLQGERTQ